MTDVEASEKMKEYFSLIESEVQRVYGLAGKARAKGFDPIDKVSIPLATNMAERVEGLISIVAPQIKNSGLSQGIIELEDKYGSQDWRIAFLIAEEVANEKYCKFTDKKEAMEVALRTGLAYITNGVVSSPLEGFVKLELKKRADGKEYFCLFFGGPIRSAGTTATCIFVALCDYIRMRFGYDVYDPTELEIKRTPCELEYFHERITNLQYLPSSKESEFLTRHLPLQIDGDASEKIEVPNYKDAPRIETNKLRNGFCLVMAEGLSQKFAKFWGKFQKWYKDFGMDHWIFLEEFVKLQKEVKAHGKVKKDSSVKVSPDYTFIKDMVAGRPVLGYPMRTGAFRLRFGRARTSGFSSDAVNPATLFILNNYIAIGTQLKMERPGKATTITTCDSIEGPIVKLKNGSVIFVDSIEKAKEAVLEMEEIIFLGDILINYGDFLNRGHILVPPGYCEEWWVLELQKASGLSKEEIKVLVGGDILKHLLSCKDAYNLSKKYNIPLHPRYTYHWGDLNNKQIVALLDWINHMVVKDGNVIIPFVIDLNKDLKEEDPKRVLELIGCPHRVVSNEYVLIEGDWADAFRIGLGFYSRNFSYDTCICKIEDNKKTIDIINCVSEVLLRDKSGLFIGARMGRPEKAKMRKLIGTPHILFPVGKEGGRLRCFQTAINTGKITGQFPFFYCESCKKETIYRKCHRCDSMAKQKYFCKSCGEIDEKCEHDAKTYKDSVIDINEYFNSAVKKSKVRNIPEMIKGVRGTSNKDHIPEHLVKGILRAANNVYVNKDGTTRYDMTELAITHFKPKEVETSIAKLKLIGYTHDTYGKELINDEQIIELRCQDLILPACPESPDEGADKVLTNVANFIDDLLENLYELPRYYNIKTREDLVGHLLIGLSPHTAAGIVCRIVGFSKTQGMFAHPYLHSIMRRDTDGDEAGVMLVLDAFLNFSREMLSNHRGATQDEPLVLTSLLVPKEVDDMVFDMDIVWEYPLEFYEACMEYKPAYEFKMLTIKQVLSTDKQYEGFGFTHNTTDINMGVICSQYKLIPTMEDKVFGQMKIAEILRCVDENDVARLIIERHFMKDIKGNLRKFSMQQFRCVDCNEKFRRPPLKGICSKCNGKILFTISEGSVVKYLAPSISLAEKYHLPEYLKQTLDLTKQRIELVFGKDDDKQEGLGKWFG